MQRAQLFSTDSFCESVVKLVSSFLEGAELHADIRSIRAHLNSGGIGSLGAWHSERLLAIFLERGALARSCTSIAIAFWLLLWANLDTGYWNIVMPDSLNQWLSAIVGYEAISSPNLGRSPARFVHDSITMPEMRESVF
jgi:hypothetical protein